MLSALDFTSSPKLSRYLVDEIDGTVEIKLLRVYCFILISPPRETIKELKFEISDVKNPLRRWPLLWRRCGILVLKGYV